MPTYDYECEKCGNRFEVFQKMSDKPVVKCTECNGKAHRLIGTGSGVIFKGSGFYQTDYKNKKKPKDTDRKTCPKAKSDGCKNCPMDTSARD